MLRYCWLLPCALWALASAVCAQQTVDATADLRAVTVFLNRAELRSDVTTNLRAGVTTVRIGPVASAIDPSSVQVSGRGNFVIVGVRYESNYLEEGQRPPALQTLEDTLTALRQQQQRLRDEAEVLKGERQLIESNRQLGGETAVTADRLAALADFYRARLLAIAERQRAIERRLQTLDERTSRYQRQVAQYRATQNTGRLVVRLRAERPGPARLNVRYLARNASWQPSYDLRAAGLDAPVRVQYQATVRQATGLNWENVQLTLSTANPALGGQQPELSPQYLRLATPTEYRQRSRKMDMSARYETDDLEEVIVVAEAAAPSVAVSRNTLATTFEIGAPLSLASGERPETVDIQQYELPAAYRHAAVPKLDPTAYLLARVTGWEVYDLLPGPASVYFEGAYVGNTYLETNTTQDTLDISLGRDPGLVVTREAVKDFTDRQLIGRKQTQAFGYRLTVRNTKAQSVDIQLIDQLPISQQDKIEVEALALDGARRDAETGRLTWTLTVPPAETKSVTLRYAVKYPKDRPVDGL